MIILVVAAALLFQLTAAIVAWRLRRITGHGTAWAFLAATALLMAVRRAVSLVSLTTVGLLKPADPANEIVGLIISVVLLLGIMKIAPVLHAFRFLKKELADSVRCLHLLADSVQDYAIFMINQAGIITTWNTGAERITGYTAEEIIGRHFSCLYSPEDVAQGVPDRCLPQAASDGRYEEEGAQIRKDGSLFRATVVTTAVRNCEGQLIGFARVTRDATERRRMQEAVRENEEKLKATVYGSPIPQFVIGRDHRVIYWNKALEEISGIKAAEAIGTTDHWRAFYGRKRPCLADLLVDGAVQSIPHWYQGKCSRSKHVANAYEATDYFMMAEKKGRWLYFTAAPLQDVRGNILGAVETLEDITASKAAEEALKDSEQKLSCVIQNSPNAIFVIGIDHRVMYWNKALENISGIRAEEVVGTNHHWRAFYSQERPCMADLLVDASPEKIPQFYPQTHGDHRSAGGTYEAIDFFPAMGNGGKWLRFRAATIRDSAGAMVGAIETLEDVTERKKAEVALQNSETRYRRLFETAQDAILILDADTGLVTDANPFLSDLLGYSHAELLGKKLWEIGPFKDKETCEAAFLELQSKGYVRYEDLPLETRDGRTVEVEFVSNVYAVDHKKVIQCNIRDITDRKKAEEEVRSAKAFLDVVIDMSPIATWIADKEGTLTRVNRSLCETINLAADEIVGKYNVLKDVNLEIQNVLPSVKTVFEKHEPARFSIPWKAAAGGVDFSGARDMHIDVSMFPILNAQGELTNVVCQWVDVTERKRAEETLASYNRQLEQANRDLQTKQSEVEEFLYTVSHDLKAPIISIQGFTRLTMERGGERLDQKQRDYLTRIAANSATMGGLLDDLLELSRIGRVEEEPQVVDLNVMVDDLFASFSPRATEKSIRLIRAGHLPPVTGRMKRMNQVFMNLIDNAIKYMPQRQAALVEVGYDWDARGPADRKGAFYVRDNGDGIARCFHTKVFEIFQRARPCTAADCGSGVGLATVKRIVETHRGKVWLESGEGQGSTFYFNLPVAARAGDTAARDTETASCSITAK
jgi:PAS domain S-box-containing protein